MEGIALLFDFILHIDKYIQNFIAEYSTWIYALLFLIIFIETGLVIMPFLPGDSLLFITGALAAAGSINYPLVTGILLVAAISGDQCNYILGRYLGRAWLAKGERWWFKRRHFDNAHNFYQRYGPITIVLARFFPFLRTFAPFVAGVAAMSYRTFTVYNIVGGTIWVVGIITAGYLFGNIPWVKENLEWVIWGLIIGPGVLALLQAWRASRR